MDTRIEELSLYLFGHFTLSLSLFLVESLLKLAKRVGRARIEPLARAIGILLSVEVYRALLSTGKDSSSVPAGAPFGTALSCFLLR